VGKHGQRSSGGGSAGEHAAALGGSRWRSVALGRHQHTSGETAAAVCSLGVVDRVRGELGSCHGGPPSGALEAIDAVTEDGAPTYFARDGLTARAMDLASGAELWQVALPDVDKVQAAVLHKLAPYRLLHQGSDRCLSFDTTRGYSPVGADRRREPSGGAAARPARCAQPASVDRLRRRAPARSGATRTRRQRDVGRAR